MTLVSAHRVVDVEAAVASGADYAEIDVRRSSTGRLVIAHGERDPCELDYEHVVRSLAGRTGVHIDLKVVSDDGLLEIHAARLALAVLPPDRIVLTSESVTGVRALREWATSEGVDLKVGLSVGRPVGHLSWLGAVRLRWSELRSPSLTDSRANVVVARHTLARLGMARIARRRGLPLLVWTVDSERGLRYWLRPGRAWMVVTNQPELALRLRDSVR